MVAKNHHGQIVVELLLCALFLAVFFVLFAELGNISIHEQKKTRFAEKEHRP